VSKEHEKETDVALSIDDAISGLARPLAVRLNIAYSSKTVRDRRFMSMEH
jgi:hypothetical protein